MSASSYVGKPCPKCRYVRTPADTSADWQCPKCGVAYAKFVQAQQGAPAAAPAVAARTASAGVARVAAGEGSTGLAMFAHLSILIGVLIPLFSLIVPIVIWVAKSGTDNLAVANAKEAINFQISLLLWGLVLVGLAFLGPLVYLAALLAVVLAIACLVLPIVAAVKAKGGEEYRYPFAVHLFS